MSKPISWGKLEMYFKVSSAGKRSHIAMDKFSRWQTDEILLIFPRNRLWYFIQGGMSQLIFWREKTNVRNFKLSSVAIFTQHAKRWTAEIFREQIQQVTNWWYFFLLFPENRPRHFMQTVCMNCQSLFSGKKNRKFKPSLAEHDMPCFSKQCRPALFVIKYVYQNFYQKPGSSNLIGWKLEVGVASIYSAWEGLKKVVCCKFYPAFYALSIWALL